MEHFLTRKARPFLITRVIEAVMAVCLSVWCIGTVCMLIDTYLEHLDWMDAFAFLVLGGLPALVLTLIIRRWLMRRDARKAARALAWETADVVTWEQLESHSGIRQARGLVERLHEKGYLCSITPDFEQVTIIRPKDDAETVVSKCAMCGAALERRTGGSWACRYCGTVAPKK